MSLSIHPIPQKSAFPIINNHITLIYYQLIPLHFAPKLFRLLLKSAILETLVAKPVVALHCIVLHGAILCYAMAYRVLHCGTAKIFSKFFGDCISRTAIRFARGNLFAMRNGERVRTGEEYQVFVIRGVDKGVVDVRGGEISKGFYRSRGIRICECALDAASSNDTAPARASGPSSCAASGKWINCSMSSG